MATSYMDFTAPDVQYFFDINQNRAFTRNANNVINRLGRDNLNTLGNVSLLDIYLSTGRVVEPHYHQNATELVYCITGSATVTLINPFTNQLTTIKITPGQVANIPQGWWHWEVANEDQTHLLAIFDAPYPEYILGSDILTRTPIEVLAHTYCLDPELLRRTLQPLHQESIVIGPTDECVAAQAQKPMKPLKPFHQTPVPNMQPLSPISMQPSAYPNVSPNAQTNAQPNLQPNLQPNVQPNLQPNIQPYAEPNVQPNPLPNAQPNMQPNTQPAPMRHASAPYGYYPQSYGYR